MSGIKWGKVMDYVSWLLSCYVNENIHKLINVKLFINLWILWITIYESGLLQYLQRLRPP